ncbi:uncharacterized protein Smp_203740 [Schistosoma mansoni]|uniref:uncharacterized protein n=1 Tax=Schistosoma mansoni TaxID=6183 RepID=UPI00022DCB3E|nr:uncharacterized protein Smp_203740 [Schistosoma mansoni]|eukprot:XP_018655019.1 uncharacterized protein Smp_203740 [Schistosoma mansoni]
MFFNLFVLLWVLFLCCFFIYLFISYWVFLIIATIIHLFINMLQKNQQTAALFLTLINYFPDLCGYDVYSLVFIYFLAKLSPIISSH